MGDAIGIGLEVRVLRGIGETRDVTEFLPEAIVRHAEQDLRVGGCKRLVRTERLMA